MPFLAYIHYIHFRLFWCVHWTCLTSLPPPPSLLNMFTSVSADVYPLLLLMMITDVAVVIVCTAVPKLSLHSLFSLLSPFPSSIDDISINLMLFRYPPPPPLSVNISFSLFSFRSQFFSFFFSPLSFSYLVPQLN